MELENCSFDEVTDMQELNDRRATQVLTKSSFFHSPTGPSDIKPQDRDLNSTLYEEGDLSVSDEIGHKDESDEEETMEGVCFDKVNNMNQEQIAKLLSEMEIGEEPVTELSGEDAVQGQKNNQTNVKLKKGKANKPKKEPENNKTEGVVKTKADQKQEKELIKEKPKTSKRGKKEKVDVKEIDSTENSLIETGKETFDNKETKVEKSKTGIKNKSVKTVLKEKVNDEAEKLSVVKGSTAGKSKRGKKNNTVEHEDEEGGKGEVNIAEIAVLDNVLSQPKELLENTETTDRKATKEKIKAPKEGQENGKEIENNIIKVPEIIDGVEAKSLKPKRGKTTKVRKIKEEVKIGSDVVVGQQLENKEADLLENTENNEVHIKPLESTKKADLNEKPTAQTKKGGRKKKDDLKSEISNLNLINEDKENVPAKSTKPNGGRGKQNKISENVVEDNKNQKEKSQKTVQESIDVKQKQKSKTPESQCVKEAKTEAKPPQRSKTTKDSEDPKKKGNNTNMQANEKTKGKSNNSKAVTNSTSETLSKNKNIKSNKDESNLQVEEPVIVRRVLRKK